MTLGQKLIQLRKQAGFSQEDLANHLDVSRQTVSKWELDETQPELSKMKLISQLFHISIDELVNNDNKSIIEKKVSNVERLAGIIIILLKGIGILFVLGILVSIILPIITTNIIKENFEKYSSATFSCQENNTPYEVYYDTNYEFRCTNCPQIVADELKSKVQNLSYQDGLKTIRTYIVDHNLSCK